MLSECEEDILFEVPHSYCLIQASLLQVLQAYNTVTVNNFKYATEVKLKRACLALCKCVKYQHFTKCCLITSRTNVKLENSP